MDDPGQTVFAVHRDYKQSSRLGGILRITLRGYSLFLNKDICSDISLEPSRGDGSNKMPQHTCYGEIWKPSLNYSSYSILSGALYKVYFPCYCP